MAYVAGMTQALADGAEYVVQMDCDFSHSPTYIPQMLATMQTCAQCRCDCGQPLRGVAGTG
ncbi:MAG: hypothetical protein R2911_34295 [Caldilineaceae bacterium]